MEATFHLEVVLRVFYSQWKREIYVSTKMSQIPTELVVGYFEFGYTCMFKGKRCPQHTSLWTEAFLNLSVWWHIVYWIEIIHWVFLYGGPTASWCCLVVVSCEPRRLLKKRSLETTHRCYKNEDIEERNAFK